MTDNYGISNNTLVQVVLVAVAWVFLFKFNMVIFGFSEIIPAVNLIFLPAMLRVVAVLVCGWSGAIGLGVGVMACMSPDDFSRSDLEIITDIAINIVGPYAGVAVGKQLMQVPDSLNGLTSKHIIMFSILGGISNAVFHQPLHFMMPSHPGFFDATITMFVGDMIGCAIMLYAMSFVIRMFAHFGKAT